MNQKKPKKIRKWDNLTQEEQEQKIKDLDWAFNAFYGMSTPLSFKLNTARSFTEMLTAIYNDICEAFPDIEKTLARKATEAMLITMRDLGAKSPGIYFSDNYSTAHIITTGFEYALRTIKGKPLPKIIGEEDLKPLTAAQKREMNAEAIQLKRKEDEELTKRKAERAPIAEALYKEYHSMKQGYIKNGEEVIDAKLQAWVHILNEVWDQRQDYGYHIVVYKIPSDEDFLNHPYYEKMICNNPVTREFHKHLLPKNNETDKKPGDLGKEFSF